MNVQAIEKRRCRLDAFLFVIERADAPIEQRCRLRLAEIVRHRREHHRDGIGAAEIVDARTSLIDHHQRVYPDIALRMPLWPLLAADQRLELWKKLIDHAELAHQRES